MITLRRTRRSFFLNCLVISGITLLCSLGFWQLDRSHQKAALLEKAAQAEVLPALTQADLMHHSSSSKNLRFAAVKFKSKIDNKHIILLDNKTHEGRAGYHVYMVAALDPQNSILVNRGFIPLGHSRADFPKLAEIIGEVTIEGYLDFAYLNPFISKAIENDHITWPLRVQQLDLPLLGKFLGKNIYPMLVTLTDNSPYAFALPPRVLGLTPTRHLGYAVQWFALAATLLLFYLFSFNKSERTN